MGPIAIAGGMLAGSLINNAANIWSTAGSNKKNREFSEYMYNKQYQDSLDFYNMQKQDNIDFWNMQNEYNSPEAQVERMRAAGLNPDFQGIQSNPAGSISAPGISTPTPMGVTHQKMPIMLDNIVADIFSSLQMFQGYQSNQLDLQAKQTNVFNELAADWLNKAGIDPTKPETFMPDGDELGLKVFRPNYDNYIHLSKSLRKSFGNFASQYVHSLRAKYSYLGDTNKYEEELKNWRERNANPLFSANYDLADSVLEYFRMVVNAEHQYNRSKFSQSAYNEDFYNTLDPSLQAGAENESAGARSAADKIMKEINQKLYKHAKNGDYVKAWFWFKVRSAMNSGQTGLSEVGSRGLESVGSVLSKGKGPWGYMGQAIGGLL